MSNCTTANGGHVAQEIEDEARDHFNNMAFEDRRFVAYFRDLERIAELNRQREHQKDRHAAIMRDLDEQIARVRKNMRDNQPKEQIETI